MRVQVHAWTANKMATWGTQGMGAELQSRGVLARQWCFSVHIAAYGSAFFYNMCSFPPCLLAPRVRVVKADTRNFNEVFGVAKNHVRWQVASMGALRCHALEKLRRFILACDAVAPL